VVEACRRLGVGEVFGLGAFPAPALHTDPVAVVGTSADPDLADRLETVPVIAELSAGIQTVLEERLHRAGIPATGLWARVPPYLAGGTHPPAALALVETLGRLAGVEVETTELVGAAQVRLSGEGLATGTEDGVACCYARQDKVWVDGPSGEPWEIYTVLEDVEMPDGQLRTVDPESGAGCCAVVGEDGTVAAGATSCC
jgi:hypothetical protein